MARLADLLRRSDDVIQAGRRWLEAAAARQKGDGGEGGGWGEQGPPRGLQEVGTDGHAGGGKGGKEFGSEQGDSGDDGA